MNCANHPDRERTAFCQNCGKPLCPECIRALGNSVFCEPCFAARTAAPGSAYTTPPGYPPPGPSGYPGPGVPGEPNPGLAALLGFIPGVGAMYNEQYAKGIVHLMVFAILVSLAHDSGIFLLFVFGWVFYMVIEAHHTARARRDGTPLPNPFGLNDLSERLGFGKAWPNSAPYAPNPDPAASAAPTPGPSAPGPDGPPYSSVPPASSYTPPYTYTPVSQWGAPQDAYAPPIPPVPPMPPYLDPHVPYQRRFPTGAVWLIGLGVFFFLANSGLFHIRGRYFGPFLMIAIGVWMFVRKMIDLPARLGDDGSAHQMHLMLALRSSFWVLFIGFVWLLDALYILSWSHSWPLFLIAGGVMLFFKHAFYGGYTPGGYGPYPGRPETPPPTPSVTTTAIVPTHDHTDNQEGR
jgi:B-box zinc finger